MSQRPSTCCIFSERADGKGQLAEKTEDKTEQVCWIQPTTRCVLCWMYHLNLPYLCGPGTSPQLPPQTPSQKLTKLSWIGRAWARDRAKCKSSLKGCTLSPQQRLPQITLMYNKANRCIPVQMKQLCNVFFFLGKEHHFPS